MRTIFQLAWSFFKEGKKKYIMSAGIFISVLCLTCLYIYVKSYDGFQKLQMLYIHSEYEFTYNNSNDLNKLYEFLPKENQGDSVEIMSYGRADVDNKSARVIALTQAVEKSPVPLMRGHCPRNEDEILITNNYADETGLSVGDTITLRITKDVSNEVIDKVYNISGVYYFTNTLDTYGEFKDEMILLSPKESDSQFLLGFQSLQNMTSDKMNALLERIDKEHIYSLTPNETAIDILYGNYETMSFKQNLIYFVVILIMILQILMNMFFLSMNDKKRYVGMLKSMGLSNIQYFLYSFFETLIYAVFNVTLGILASQLVMYFALPYFASLEPEFTTPFPFPLELDMYTIMFIFCFNFSLLFVCNLVAYTRLGKYSIIQLLKDNMNDKVIRIREKKAIFKKTNAEIFLAKRNRKRNRISNLSIFISVVSCITILIIGNFLFKTYFEYFPGDNIVDHRETLILGLSVFLMTIAIINQFITISASILAKKKEYKILISIGLTKKQLLRLLFFEYGSIVIKGLVIGIGISISYVYYVYTRNLAEYYEWIFDWFLVVKASFMFALFSVLSVYYAYYLLLKEKTMETIRE